MKRALVVLPLLVLLVVCPAFAAEEAAPTVSITSPEPGITIATDTVEVTAVYSAPKGAAVKLVELIVDGLVVESAPLEPGQSGGLLTLTWQASGYLDGNHQVVMRVTDTKDRVARATIPVTLTRDLPNAASPIDITAPVPGATVAGRTAVTLDATDPSIVKYVVFLVDNVFKAMTNIPPFIYYWDTSGYLNGFHQLQAKAYLSDGTEALSRAIEVCVDNPSGATTLKTPPTAAAPKPELTPARVAEAALPPPARAEAATPYGKAIEVTKAETGPPGTAPYISETGDLIQPSSAAFAARAGDDTSLEAATVPDAAEAPVTPVAAEVTIGTPPVPIADPTRVAAESEIASAPAGPVAVGSASAVAPVQVAVPPTPTGALARSSAGSAPLSPATAEPRPAEASSATISLATVSSPPIPRPVTTTAAARLAPVAPPAPKQIAMLPPRPVVTRQPEPKLTAEPAPDTATYTAQAGDCLYGIAAAHGVSPSQLAQANGLEAPYEIRIGQQLTIPQTSLYINGRPLSRDVPAMFAGNGGHHMVPLRAVVEQIGGTVSWVPASHQASAAARSHQVTVTIGCPEARVDGKSVTLTISPTIVADRTLVPARFLGDALDLTVAYDRGVTRIAAR